MVSPRSSNYLDRSQRWQPRRRSPTRACYHGRGAFQAEEVMMQSARLRSIGAYLFADLDRKQEELAAKGVDVISLGVGDPDLPTPPHIIKAMEDGARDPHTHRYPPYRGTGEFRKAAAAWFARRFGVTLDADR